MRHRDSGVLGHAGAGEWSQRGKRDILLFGMLRATYDIFRITTLRLGMWAFLSRAPLWNFSIEYGEMLDI